MSKLTFKLRNAKDKSGSIQLVFQYGKDKRVRYSTGFKIQNIKNWDKKEMKIKNVVEELDRVYINNKLNDLKAKVEKAYAKRTIEENKEVSDDYIKDICDKVLGRNIQEGSVEKLELLPFFEWYIKYYQVNPLMSSSKVLGKGTARTYRNALSILKRFDKEMNYRLRYEKIGQAFYRDFMKWLQEQDYSINYIGTQIKILKTVLNASLELGYHDNREHLKKYFKKPIEDVNNVYLNESELNSIFELDLTNTKTIKINKYLYLNSTKLDQARDLFLISANSGLRVSDFNRLKKENLIEMDGKLFIKIVTKKTNNPVTIPVNKMVREILEKRNGNLPESMPEQHINYAIKKIAELAEINSIEKFKRTQGKEKKSIEKNKYDLISNHTARRSFCTNAYLAGVPVQDIMLISGHKTEKVFYSYIKANDFQRAIKAGNHPFFD